MADLGRPVLAKRDVEAKMAAVLLRWLRDRGYPVVADDALVPIGWLRGELERLLADPQVDGRATPHSAWNRAVMAVQESLFRYEHELDDIAGTEPTDA